MSVFALVHRAQCDICKTHADGDNYFTLIADLGRRGWGFGLRRDGTPARRGGKDYCPDCRSTLGPATKDGAE